MENTNIIDTNIQNSNNDLNIGLKRVKNTLESSKSKNEIEMEEIYFDSHQNVVHSNNNESES